MNIYIFSLLEVLNYNIKFIHVCIYDARYEIRQCRFKFNQIFQYNIIHVHNNNKVFQELL